MNAPTYVIIWTDAHNEQREVKRTGKTAAAYIAELFTLPGCQLVSATVEQLAQPMHTCTEICVACAAEAQRPTISSARNADELLTALADIPRDQRASALAERSVGILRDAADLCGEDAEDLTKRAAIAAIVANF